MLQLDLHVATCAQAVVARAAVHDVLLAPYVCMAHVALVLFGRLVEPEGVASWASYASLQHLVARLLGLLLRRRLRRFRVRFLRSLIGRPLRSLLRRLLLGCLLRRLLGRLCRRLLWVRLLLGRL